MSHNNLKALTLSIIIPVHNEESYIGACLDSIANQTIMPDEVIVVDNNCKDRTAEVVSEYSFATLIQETTQGIVYARNSGFNKASSDIIARIDADTNLKSSWVANVKALASSLDDNSGAVTGPCDFRDWDLKMAVFWGHRVLYFWTSHLFLGHRTLFGSNMFIMRSTWQEVSTSICLRNDIHEDMDLAVHVTTIGSKVYFSKKMEASVSPRRIFKMWHYPVMWLRTKLVTHTLSSIAEEVSP